MAFQGLSSLPDDPLGALPNDPAPPPAKGKGLESLPDDPLSALSDDPAGAPVQEKVQVSPPGTAMVPTAGIPRNAALGGGSKPQTPPNALQGAIDQVRAEKQAQVDRLVAQGMPREQAETYEVGTASGVSPERWKEVQAEDEARKKSPSLRAFEGFAHGTATPIVNLASVPSGLVRETGRLVAEAPGLEDAGKRIEQAGDALRPTEAKKVLKQTAPKTEAGQAAQFIGHVFGMVPTLGILGPKGFAVQSAGNTMNDALDSGAGPLRTLAAGGGQALKDLAIFKLFKAFAILPTLRSGSEAIDATVNTTARDAGTGLVLTYAGNAIDKFTWDPKRGVLDGTGDAVSVGLAFGLLGLLGRRMPRPEKVGGESEATPGSTKADYSGDTAASRASDSATANFINDIIRTAPDWKAAEIMRQKMRSKFTGMKDGDYFAGRFDEFFPRITSKNWEGWVPAVPGLEPPTAPGRSDAPPPSTGKNPVATVNPTPEAASAEAPLPATQPVTAGPESPAAPVGRGPVAVADQAPGAPAEPVAGSAPAPAAGAGRPAGPDVEILAQQVQELQGLSDQLEARAKEHPHVEVARAEAEEAADLLQAAKDRLGYIAPDHPVLAPPEPAPAPQQATPQQVSALQPTGHATTPEDLKASVSEQSAPDSAAIPTQPENREGIAAPGEPNTFNLSNPDVGPSFHLESEQELRAAVNKRVEELMASGMTRDEAVNQGIKERLDHATQMLRSLQPGDITVDGEGYRYKVIGKKKLSLTAVDENGNPIDGGTYFLYRYDGTPDMETVRFLLDRKIERPSSVQSDRRTAPHSDSPERRIDEIHRKATADMTPEEMQVALKTDHLTGLGNARAFSESPIKPHLASVDADSLKWVNDNMGHETGDALLKVIGDALRAGGLGQDAYHPHGDEFYIKADDTDTLHKGLRRAYLHLEQNPIEFIGSDGTTTKLKGGFSYGLGPDLQSADAALQAHKAQREKSGERAKRGEEPPGLSRSGSELPGDQGGGQVHPESEAQAGSPGRPGITQGAKALAERIAEKRNRKVKPGGALLDLAQPRLLKSEPVTLKGTRTGTLDGSTVNPYEEGWPSQKPAAGQTVHPRAQAILDKALEAKDVDTLGQILHPGNKGLRRQFEEKTGVTLPKGWNATREAIAKHFAEKPVEAPAPEKTAEVAEKPKKTDTLPKKEASDGGTDSAGPLARGGVKAGTPGRSKAGSTPSDVSSGKPDEVPAPAAGPVHADGSHPEKTGDIAGAGTGDSPAAAVRPDRSEAGKPAVGAETLPEDQVGDAGKAQQVEQPDAERNARNHSIEKQEDISPYDLSSEAQSKKAARANIDALRLLKKLEAEGRKATPEEQKTLAKYVGWGATTLSKMVDWGRGNKALQVARFKEALEALKAAGGNPTAPYTREVIDQAREILGWNIANQMDRGWSRPSVDSLLTQANDAMGATSVGSSGAMDQGWIKDYFPIYRELAELLTPEEMKAAWNSTLNAHYTSVPIVKGMWDMVQRMGFKGGTVLEPSAGIGNFLGLMPKGILPKSVLQAVELDKTTGAFLKHLYPDAKVHIRGFQDAKIAPNSQDLVITNVPFGDISIGDEAHPEWGSPSIHNYFFLKGMEKLKPGGLMVAITSHFTLDSQGAGHRKAMAGMGDLVAAVRLPRTAFKANAGTEVVTDILIFRKKAGDGFRGEPFQAALPTSMGLNRAGEEVVVPVNEYFQAHPEMVLGEWGVGSMRGNEELTVNPKGDLAEELAKAAALLPKDIANRFVLQGHDENEVHQDDEDPRAEGHLFVKDGQPFVIEGGKTVVHPWVAEAVQKWPGKTERAQERAKVVVAYASLRDEALAQVARMMTDATTEAELAKGRQALAKAYDAFTLRGPKKAFVPVNDSSNSSVFGDESSWARVCALENVGESEDGKPVYSKADIFTKRTIEPFKEPTTAASMPDAVEISMNMRGGLDLDYMAKLLSKDVEGVKYDLASRDLAFDNPISGIWEPSHLYLSGEVRQKLREAQEAAKGDEAYQRHVKALEAIQPAWMDLGRISAQPGSTWLPPQAVVGIMQYAAGIRIHGLRKDPITGRWALDDGQITKRAIWDELGVPSGIQPWKLAEAVMLNKPLRVTHKDEDGNTIVDVVKTQQAQEAKSKAIERWQEGFYKMEEDERKLIEDAYNTEVNNSVKASHPEPEFEGFPGMASTWGGRTLKLESYQKIGVMRAVRHSTLLGHAVGSGKTITLIATAMEQRRLGFAKRPMIVAHNATFKQFVNAAYQLYPNAKILAPGKSERTRSERAKLYARIATGDWDMVIIPTSFYEMIPVSKDRVQAWINAQLADITEALKDAKGDKIKTKDLERLRDSIISQGGTMMSATTEGGDDAEGGATTAKALTSKQGAKKAAKATDTMATLSSRANEDRFATFEDLGIDSLLVDEAHAFKNGFFMTSLGNVKGLNASASSKRAVGMLLKARSIQEKTAGKNIVMATGTPITNSMSEAWVMMNYLRPDLLEEVGAAKFDEFISNFGSIESDTEYTAAGKFEPVERLREFVNLQQLGTLWNQVVHVVPQRMILREKLPDLIGGGPRTIQVKPTQAQDDASAWWRDLMDKWKTWDRDMKRKVPVGLLYSQISRFLSLDMRTIQRGVSADEAGGKIPAIVKEAVRIYHETTDQKGAQVIFSDVKNAWKAEGPVWAELGLEGGEPGFNAFKEIKHQLIRAGIPENEIIIVDDIKNNDEAKAEVFEQVNRGEIRFIIGSTPRLGVGVNIQKRLVALHNADIPGRPCDYIQRLGRAWRAGNMFDKIYILNYGVERTLDALMAQRNLNKSKFITQIMEGEFEGDKAEDIGTEASFSWAEIRGALSGDPNVLKYGETQAQIAKLQSKEVAWNQGRGDARVKILQAQRGMEAWKKEADALGKFAGEVPKIQAEIAKVVEELKKAKDDEDPLETWMSKIEKRVEAKDMPSIMGNTTERFRTKLPGGLTVLRTANASWNLTESKPEASLKIRVTLEGTDIPESVGMSSGTVSPRAQFALEAMSRAIEKTQEWADVRKKWIAEAQESMPVLEAKQGPFPDLAKLRELRTQAAELEASINATAEAEKQARLDAKKEAEGGDEIQAISKEAWLDKIAQEEGRATELHAFSHPLVNLLGNLFGTRQRPDSISVPSAFEEVERRWREAKKGADPTPMLTKAIESLRRAKAAFTRHFDHIDPNESPLMARVHDILRQYEAGPAFARAAAHDMVYEVTKGLGPKRIDLFTRVLVLRDIIRNVDHGVDAQDVELPFGYANVKEATFDLERFEKVLNEPGNEAVGQALQKRHDQAKAIVQTLVNHGLLDPDTLHNVGSYYHRQVMTYLNKRNVGSTGSDVRLKRKGFQMARHGGANDFNAAYEQAEAEWVADAMSLIVKKESLDRLEAVADLAPKLRAQADRMNLDAYVERNPGLSAKELDGLKPSEIAKALGEDAVEWRTLVPEDYILWQPAKGNHFYPALTISERLLDQFLEGDADLSKEDFKSVLAVGGKKKQWAIPQNLATQLDNFVDRDSSEFGRFWVGLQSTWKQWQLISPMRIGRYSLNNMMGDLDIAVAYDPRIVSRHFGKAASEMWSYQVTHKASPELVKEIQDAIRRGVVESGITIAEIPDIDKAGAFRLLTSERPNGNVVQKVWGGLKTFSTWRENVLRLAAYRFFQEELAKGRNLYAASNRAQVDALSNQKDKAAKLARELIGDYGNVSVAGQYIRTHMIPFYSWMEVNAPRYVRLLKNLPHEGEPKPEAGGEQRTRIGMAGRTLAVKAPSLLLRMAVVFGLIYLFNQLFFKDEYEELRRQKGFRNGMILGRREDGSIRYIRMDLAITDALDWLSASDLGRKVAGVNQGKETWGDIAADAAKGPAEKVIKGWEPFSKTLFELVLGRSISYPSVWREGASLKPGGMAIRDKMGYVLKNVTPLDRLWNKVTNKPARPASMKDGAVDALLAYSVDPGEASYFLSRDIANEWMKKNLKREEFSGTANITEKGNALYYFKRASQWGDKERAAYWLGEFYSLGGKPKDIRESIKRGHPLGSVPPARRPQFMRSLNEKDREVIADAIAWYQRLNPEARSIMAGPAKNTGTQLTEK